MFSMSIMSQLSKFVYFLFFNSLSPKAFIAHFKPQIFCTLRKIAILSVLQEDRPPSSEGLNADISTACHLNYEASITDDPVKG